MLTVFALPGVALDHLVASLKARESHVRHRVLLVVSLLGGDDWREGGEREVNTGEAVRISLARKKSLAGVPITYGTRLVWNSLRSTLSEPSKRSEAVMEETTATRLVMNKMSCGAKSTYPGQ